MFGLNGTIEDESSDTSVATSVVAQRLCRRCGNTFLSDGLIIDSRKFIARFVPAFLEEVDSFVSILEVGGLEVN